MALNKYNQSIVEDCLAYFEQKGIPAQRGTDDVSVFVGIQGGDGRRYSVQISTDEVVYRAGIFRLGIDLSEAVDDYVKHENQAKEQE
jgi:hypothetical protein